jgi:hypothetical protein
MPRLPADIWKCWDVIRDDGCYAEPPELNCASVYGTINKIVNVCLFQICDRCETGRMRE